MQKLAVLNERLLRGQFELMCQSLIFGILTLIFKFNLNFVEKDVIFEKFESNRSCSNFLRQLKIRS